MDRDWDRSMRHVIIHLLGHSQVTLTYTKKTEIKTKAAVLEAAKRISYFRKVVVVTANQNVHRTVKCLSQAAQEEHGLDSDWFRSVLPGESVPDAESDCVVAVDVEDVTKLQNHSLKMVVSRSDEVLLIGNSASSKSSTVNTPLHKHDLINRSLSAPSSPFPTTSQTMWQHHQKDTMRMRPHTDGDVFKRTNQNFQARHVLWTAQETTTPTEELTAGVSLAPALGVGSTSSATS
ncbi:uncharacterized protein [Littorina saxatilis]|uniref:uncharacterized protein isoform X2 n=1 Tax=Littorina saxatilis TaxID=31220 RepID=UPI0038B4FCDA